MSKMIGWNLSYIKSRQRSGEGEAQWEMIGSALKVPFESEDCSSCIRVSWKDRNGGW